MRPPPAIRTTETEAEGVDTVIGCEIPNVPPCKGYPHRYDSGEWGLYLDRPTGGSYMHLGAPPDEHAVPRKVRGVWQWVVVKNDN